MLYTIIATNVADSTEQRTRTRPRHLAYIQGLIDAGRVVVAGPQPAIDSPDPGPAGFAGSLIVAEFDSLEAARDWAANDPYSLEGVFEHVEVRPFIQVAP